MTTRAARPPSRSWGSRIAVAPGDGVYFVNALPDMQPDVRTLHAGCPTTRGEKWIITQFIRSRTTR